VVNDDLGTPRAVAIMWEMLKSDLSSKDKLELWDNFNKVLGLMV